MEDSLGSPIALEERERESKLGCPHENAAGFRATHLVAFAYWPLV